MSDSTTDPFHDALDAFIGTVFWSDDQVSLEQALSEAIEDWVAIASAEHNASRPFAEVAMTERLAAGLHQMAAAVGALTETELTDLTMALALSNATADWLGGAPDSPGP